MTTTPTTNGKKFNGFSEIANFFPSESDPVRGEGRKANYGKLLSSKVSKTQVSDNPTVSLARLFEDDRT